MDVKVIPLGLVHIDWPAYIDECKQAGKSPLNHLDAHYMRPNELSSFLASLIDSSDPRQVLRTRDTVLRHAFASFMIKTSEDAGYAINRETELKIIQLDEELFVVSGDLKEWKYAIIDLCKMYWHFRIRCAMNMCLLLFEKGGLEDIWGMYKKDSQQDGTFTLSLKDN